MRLVAGLALVLAALLAPVATAQERQRAGGAQPERRSSEHRTEALKPNVLMLMTDDQTLESIRVMPAVNRLIGGRGTTFTRSFVNFSLCCPSRATFLTGQYAHNHTVVGNRPPAGGYLKLDKSNWLPLWLQRAGYRTIQLGKFLNRYGRDNDPAEVPPGWDEWYTSVDPSTYSFYDYTLNENGVLNTYGADGDPAFYQTDYYARRASEIIGRNAPRRRPFFLSVAFLAPHGGAPRTPDDPEGLATPDPAPRHRDRFAAEPLPLPGSFNEADVSDKPPHIQRRRPLTPERIAAITEGYQQRLESLLAVDEGVALILDTLRRTGELDDTLVLFTSDNGYFHGEHRIQAGKVLPYEPSIRVPLLMRGPGVPRGERRGQLVTNADLAPTILDAAGARPRRVQDGRSLFGLLEDRGLEWGRDLLLQGGAFGGFTGIRTYRYVYIEYARGDRELYDLEVDPDQNRSVHAASRYAAVRDDLARRLARLRRCRGAGCRAKPRVALRTPFRGPRMRFRGGRCVDRGLRARVIGSERGKVVRTRFTVNGRRFKPDRRAPFATPIRPRAYRPGRPVRIRAQVELRDGRIVTLDERERACRRAGR